MDDKNLWAKQQRRHTQGLQSSRGPLRQAPLQRIYYEKKGEAIFTTKIKERLHNEHISFQHNS